MLFNIKSKYRCICCQDDRIFKLEDISRDQWEEHHYDCSKSLINPRIQFQGLFIINCENIDELETMKRICLPNNWFLRGEDILDFKINNLESPYYKCLIKRRNPRLIIDIHELSLKRGDAIFLIVNLQDTMKTKEKSFKNFLIRIGCSKKKIKKLDLDYAFLYSYSRMQLKLFPISRKNSESPLTFPAQVEHQLPR